MKEKSERKHQSVVVGPNFLASWFVYDFQICADYDELKQTLDHINRHGYDLISVTQDTKDFFTVFFRRRACG